MPGHTQELVTRDTPLRGSSQLSSSAFLRVQAARLMMVLGIFCFLSLPLLTGCGTTIISGSTSPGLSGNPSKYGIQLKWNAPGGSDPAVSYNVYRELTTGTVGFQQINTAPVLEVTFTDKAVQLGTSYTYVVRAVDAEGAESDPSNVATVAVPSS
jgi:hypothetical protein